MLGALLETARGSERDTERIEEEPRCEVLFNGVTKGWLVWMYM